MTGPVPPQPVPYPMVRLTVIRAGTFTDDVGALRAQRLLSEYRRDIGLAMDAWGRRQTSPVGDMPWTRYRNHFWEYQFGSNYEGSTKQQLSNGLVPFVTGYPDGATLPDGVEFEGLRYPFGTATALHLSLRETQPRETEDEFAERLDRVLGTVIAPGRALREGAPAAWIGGDTTGLREGPAVVVISGLRDPGVDALVAAQRLSERYRGATKATPFALKHVESAMCVNGGTLGLTMPTEVGTRTGRRFQCFHHNITTLLMTLEAMLGAQVGPRPAGAADWYQSQAARILTDLHVGATADAGSVYRSTLSQAWIDRTKQANRINAAAARNSDGGTERTLPEPDPPPKDGAEPGPPA